MQDEYFDPKKRAQEKRESRERDDQALASGEKTREQLLLENSPFVHLRVRPNYLAVLKKK